MMQPPTPRPRQFFISDHHFWHPNIIVFTRANGEKIRPFGTLHEMHEHIISKHNDVVGKDDVCFFGGDVSFRDNFHDLLARMNGRKYLIMGNHDKFSARSYLQSFVDVMAVKKFNKFILSHYPIREGQLGKKCNVHGHTHEKSIPDPRYINISVEVLDYTPISIQEIEDRIDATRNSRQEQPPPVAS